MISRNVVVVVISLVLLGGAAFGTAVQLSSIPPHQPSLGDVWMRAKDGASMVYVPAGEFLMGSGMRDAEVDFG